MRKLRLFFAILLLLSIQVIVAQPISPNKFSIQLPNDWKGNPRFLEKLSRIIKEHIPQLEKKDECFGCKAAYQVSFYITPATVKYIFHNPASDYQFTTYYNFFSYMDVSDSTGNVVHRLILNDTLTDHAITKKLYGRGTTTPPVQHTLASARTLLPAASGLKTDVTVLGRTRPEATLVNIFDADDFIKKNSKALIPTDAELWSKVKEILRDYQLEEAD